MNFPTILCGLALSTAAVAVTGCAATKEPAPSATHPANPAAAEAPLPKASATLKEDAGTAAAAAAPAETSAAAPAAAADPAAPQAYTCPHHPKVMQAEPGECPYCNMALVPTTSRQMSPVRGVTPPAEPADQAGHGGHK